MNSSGARNENEQTVEAHRHRFTTPLRRAFKRLKVTRKPKSSLISSVVNPLSEHSNYASLASEAGGDDGLLPPPAPRPSRWATPMNTGSPASPIPSTVSRSSCMLTVRSGLMSTSTSHGSFQEFNDALSSSPPALPMPRGDLFQLGLTPVRSVRSSLSFETRATAGEPLFGPALPATQRISTVNLARETSDVDMIEILDRPHPGELTPTPRTSSVSWLPSLSVQRHAMQNPSTTAVFESRNPSQPRRTSFMSKLVGSAWGLAGIGFTSVHGNRRGQSIVPVPRAVDHVFTPLPSIPLGKDSIEQAVFGPAINAGRMSATSLGVRLQTPAEDLPAANSTFRSTGSKSRRDLDYLDGEDVRMGSASQAKVERPKKKRRSDVSEVEPVLSPLRVTRSMSVRQAQVGSPNRVTRSTSKRLAETANKSTRRSYEGARRSKSLKRV
ncbi:hypothetical protein RhiJN_08658 [Ceratobasidium sp. AG-Ba]|nr:hypothetical protein RhiJN_08658 [Ceratobasidium sp. AG-Ba]